MSALWLVLARGVPTGVPTAVVPTVVVVFPCLPRSSPFVDVSLLVVLPLLVFHFVVVDPCVARLSAVGVMVNLLSAVMVARHRSASLLPLVALFVVEA